MNKQFNSVLRLRRDTIENYQKIQETFIPANGEICLVDTQDGLNFVCGDGKSLWKDLILTHVVSSNRGYFFEGEFYWTENHDRKFPKQIGSFYLDIPTKEFYLCQETEYICLNGKTPEATDKVSGTVKIYNMKGQNIDGTMTQKAISDELDDKIEMKVHPQEEMLELNYDLV